MKTVHHQDTLHYFVPLQQGSQPATSAPSKCSYKARFLQREKRSGTSKLVAVLCFRSNAWWGEHWEELFWVPGISTQDVRSSSAYVHQKRWMLARIWVPFPCSVSSLGTEPAPVHPYVPSGLLFWRRHHRCNPSERRSTEAELSDVTPFLMPLVMQQHVFIFTYKYKMVRYHIFKRKL